MQNHSKKTYPLKKLMNLYVTKCDVLCIHWSIDAHGRNTLIALVYHNGIYHCPIKMYHMAHSLNAFNGI